jgi:hypothetical protein
LTPKVTANAEHPLDRVLTGVDGGDVPRVFSGGSDEGVVEHAFEGGPSPWALPPEV